MAWSCATWFREPCQVRKEAAVSGVPGAPQPTGPEWSALRGRAALQREGVRGHSSPTDEFSRGWGLKSMSTSPRLIARSLDMPNETKNDRRWLALLILCAGFLMIVLDMTIVNVALPSIKNDLGFTQASLAWVVNAYLIAYAGVLLLAGRLGDLIGRKRIFLIGLVAFTAASMLLWLSVSPPMIIAARFLQGIGGAVSSAVILGMVVTMFPEPGERARAIGVFSFVASAGASIGLLAGGIITQAVSWHWIFFVNLPIGIVIAVLAARLLESDRGIGLGQGADILGAFLVTAGLMLGVFAIVQSSAYGLVSTPTLGFGGVAVILLVAFVVRPAKVRNPLLPLRLFASLNLSAANVIQSIGVVPMLGLSFMGSLDMQRVLGYRPLTIGLAFLPVSVGMGALSIGVTARLIMRFGARNVLLVGFGLISGALLLAARGPVSG